MAVVERRLHDRKELWFPCLVCKNNEFFALRKLILETLSSFVENEIKYARGHWNENVVFGTKI